MTNPTRRPKRAGRVALGAAIALAAVASFGLSPHDQAAFRTFNEAVDRWQVNPEFRRIAFDYSVAGSAAADTHPFGIPARRTIITLRSVPGLPKKFAVNPTSRLHYENFSRGPLSAYLHLCSEQDVPQVLGAIEAAGKTSRTAADLQSVLAAFKMDFPVAHDAGALQSIDDLLQESDAGRPYTVRTNIGPLLSHSIHQIAAELHVPAQVQEMTPREQRFVLDRLDPYVRAHDPELWRTKQVNDLCGGVWAQVFGPPYNGLIVPFLAIWEACRAVLVLLLGAIALRAWRKRAISPPKPADVVAAKPGGLR